MEKTNQNLLQKLTQILNVEKIISPEDIQEIRGVLVGVLANNKKEVESLTAETRELVNKVLNKVLDEHDTYLEKTKQIAQEAKSDTTEAIQATMKSLEEVKNLCKEVMDCKPENGKDADEEHVIGEVLNRIKLPEYKEVVLDDGGAIVDKINSLPVNEENQIDAKHIKNLPEVKGGRVISGGVTRKIVEQMIAAAGGGSGSGDVVGPASSTDNAIVRFDGTTGKLIQNSVSTIDDTGILSTTSAIISGTNGNGHINLRHQASDAVATGQSTALFANSLGDIEWKNDGNYYTTLKTSSNTADRVYTFLDSSYNVLGSTTALTTGSVLFANSSGLIAQDNSNLFWDDTNKRLGIGTTSPAQALHVRSATTYQGIFVNGNVAPNISFAQSTGTTAEWKAGISGNSGTSFSISSGASATDRILINSSGLVGLNTNTNPTHTLTLSSTSTGIALYNTADQTTNYERGLISWASNILTIATGLGGTGIARAVRLTAVGSGSNGTFTVNRGALPLFEFSGGSTATTSGNIIDAVYTNTASSGTITMMRIAPTINQSSTAGYTALLVNPTETTTGSGTKLLADFQVGGSSKASIDNTGKITTLTTIELGNASDTTLSRSSAGVLAVEGVVVPTISSTNTLTNKTISGASNTLSNISFGSMTFLGCRVTQSAGQSVTANTLTALTFDTESYDTDTMHDNVTNNTRVTFTTAGKYNISAGVTTDANAVIYGGVRLNGTTYICKGGVGNAGASTANGINLSLTYNFSAGDYIELLGTFGTTQNTKSGVDGCFITASRIG